MSVSLTPNPSPRRARGASRVAGTNFTLRQALEKVARVAAVLLILAALVDGVQWLRASFANERIRSASVEDLAGGRALELQFAHAHALVARGDPHRALAEYKHVSESSGSALSEAALFNSGNLYLRLAIDERSKGDEAQAMPLVELAKQSYRELLRANPAHWDAKYNLERVLRLAPDVAEPDPASHPPPPARERAATTMRGFTLGLP